MQFNKGIAAVALAAAAAGGGAALLLSPGIGAAQEDQQDTPSDSPSDSTQQVPGMPDGGAPEGAGPGCAPGGPGPNLDAAAEAIGIDVEELGTAVRDGQTIAEVAEDNGVDPDDVVSAMVASAEEHLDQAVADGDLSQEEADEIKADLPERIAELVENGPPAGGPPGGPQGPMGSGGQEQGTSPDTESTSVSF